MKASLVLVSALILTSVGWSDPGRWHDRNGERFRSVQSFDLGRVRIGFDNRRFDNDTVDIVNNPRIQCNLTHIRLSSLNDAVKILAVEVEYARTDRFGNAIDRLDLNDSDDFRRWGGRGDGRRDDRGGGNWGRRQRMNRGIELFPGDSSPLLDLDDVKDGFPDGRCVKSIRVIGIDMTNSPRGRGFDGGRIRPIETPAFVKVEGFLNRVGRGGGDHGGRRDDLGRDRRGDDRGPGGRSDDWGRDRRDDDRGPGGGGHRPPDMSTEPFGTTGFMERIGGREVILGVGPMKGSFRGLKIEAKDDSFQILNITVEFMNDQRVSFPSEIIRENDSRILMFNHDMSRDSRASLIKRVIILGQTPLMARSKAQLIVYGIKAR